jgi:hypothetical protein
VVVPEEGLGGWGRRWPLRTIKPSYSKPQRTDGRDQSSN